MNSITLWLLGGVSRPRRWTAAAAARAHLVAHPRPVKAIVRASRSGQLSGTICTAGAVCLPHPGLELTVVLLGRPVHLGAATAEVQQAVLASRLRWIRASRS